MEETNGLAVLLGASVAIMAFVLIVGLIFLVVYLIGLSKLFKKANIAGWKAIVPFYNTYLLIEMAGLNWWYFLIKISGSICSIIGLSGVDVLCNLLSMAVNFFIFYNIAKKMNRNPIGFAVASIFVSPIVIMILGYSSSFVYDANIKVSPNGPITDDSTNNNTTYETTSNTMEEVNLNDTNTTDTVVNNDRYCTNCGHKIIPNGSFCENCGKHL